MPMSAIESPTPVDASETWTCASAAEYWALMTSFFERNCSVFASSCFSDSISFSCCDSRSAICWSSDASLLNGQLLALQRCASEILTSRGHRLARLSVELGALFTELLLLERQPLLGGGDVGDPLLDVLEVLDLALIRIVERLARVLGAVNLL